MISIAVLAVPQRLTPAKQLVTALEAQLDEGDRVALVVDMRCQGTAKGAALAWGTADAAQFSHHFVVQDDAIPSKDFVRRAKEAIAEHPEAAWSFQLASGLRAPVVALPSFVRTPRVFGAVALAMPATLAPRAAKYLQTAKGKHDDELLAGFFRTAGVPFYVTAPSLVQHGDLPSTMKHDSIRHHMTALHFYDDLDEDAQRFAWHDAHEVPWP